MSVVVADHHEITRLGVQSVVEGLDGEVVATATTGLETVSMVEEHTPDLLVLSLRLPHLNGCDILYHLQRRSIDVNVLVLTTCDDEDRVRSVFQQGASAYVLKQDPMEELYRAIERVRSGRRYISRALPEELMDAAPDQNEDSGEEDTLSIRERQVVQLTAEGYTSREVGEYLNISHRTVEKHRENIKKKLGVESLVDMARFALRRNVLPDVRFLHSRSAG
jgi:DNA-binding NarL/FixJ family response regulator